jgi:hypothetical protein
MPVLAIGGQVLETSTLQCLMLPTQLVHWEELCMPQFQPDVLWHHKGQGGLRASHVQMGTSVQGLSVPLANLSAHQVPQPQCMLLSHPGYLLKTSVQMHLGQPDFSVL